MSLLQVWSLLAAAVLVSVLVGGPEHSLAQSNGDVISIRGTVVNGTTGAQLPSNLAVLMLVTGADGALIGTGQTSPDQAGLFEFLDIELVEDSSYTLSVDYDGVFYGTTLATSALEQAITLTVFEPTQDTSVISVSRQIMVLAAIDANDRLVTAFEFAEVSNISDRTLQPDLTNQAQISFLRFALPPNAADLNVESDLRGGDIITIPTGFALTSPIPPGHHSMVFSYSFPYEDNSLSYRQSLPQGAAVFQVLVRERLTSVSIPGLNSVPPVNIQGTSYRAWEGRDIPPGRGLELVLTGLPEPGIWARFSSSVTDGTFWQVAIPSAVGAALVALLFWGLAHRYQSTTSHQGTGPAGHASLVQAVARLDEQYQRGQVPEYEYQQRRHRLIAEGLGNNYSEQDSTAGP